MLIRNRDTINMLFLCHQRPWVLLPASFSHTPLSALSRETSISTTQRYTATPRLWSASSWREDKGDIAVTWSISQRLFSYDLHCKYGCYLSDVWFTFTLRLETQAPCLVPPSQINVIKVHLSSTCSIEHVHDRLTDTLTVCVFLSCQ